MKKTNDQILTCGAACSYGLGETQQITFIDKMVSAVKSILPKK